jgi:hypothetical protein
MSKLAPRIVMFALSVPLWIDGAFSGGSNAPDHDLKPSILRLGEDPRLELPKGAIQAIERDFPRLRIPTHEDIKGEWATLHRDGRVAYATWGDYDGDRMTDIALILLGADEWKCIVLNQRRSGVYVSAVLGGGRIGATGSNLENPWAAVLETVPRGTPLTFGAGEDAVTIQYERDAIEMQIVDGALWVFHWDGKRYQRRIFGHE